MAGHGPCVGDPSGACTSGFLVYWSYDTLAQASLRANMTVVGLTAAPKIKLKSVRSMQRNTPGLLDRRIGPIDMDREHVRRTEAQSCFKTAPASQLDAFALDSVVCQEDEV
ncbi:hypothetical protein EMCRGX_G005891 [Ephydatia muelleri]